MSYARKMTVPDPASMAGPQTQKKYYATYTLTLRIDAIDGGDSKEEAADVARKEAARVRRAVQSETNSRYIVVECFEIEQFDWE